MRMLEGDFIDELRGDEHKAMALHHAIFPSIRSLSSLSSVRLPGAVAAYGYESVAADRQIQEPGFIESASPEDVRKMLIWCARGERFCDGHWGHVWDNEWVFRLLDRLREIRAAMEV